MLWNSSAILGYSIKASDGEIGVVADMLFDRSTWSVRWLVVDTGNWLLGRKVLLPVAVLGQPDPALHLFPVALTQTQVRDSPNVESEQPISHAHEAEIYNYYGWNPYWRDGGSGTGEEVALRGLKSSDVKLLSAVNQNALGTRSAIDAPYLISAAKVMGYALDATDGGIGHCQDLLLDTNSWKIRYLAIDTTNWWPGERVLISPRSVEMIDVDNESLSINISRDKVKGSPAYKSGMTVDGRYDESFETYYGIRITHK